MTGPAARERVHELRDRVDAILVGAGTVRADDPQLTARPRGRLARRQPLRVVLSASLDVPPQARIFSEPGRVLVLTASANRARAAALEARGAEVVRVPGRRGRLDLGAALEALAAREVVHLLVEGGAEIFGQLIEEGLADAVMLFVAPKILGEGLSWAALGRREKMAQAIELEDARVEQVGIDVLIAGRLHVDR